jgi:hypothetical protein
MALLVLIHYKYLAINKSKRRDFITARNLQVTQMYLRNNSRNMKIFMLIIVLISILLYCKFYYELTGINIFSERSEETNY